MAPLPQMIQTSAPSPNDFTSPSGTKLDPPSPASPSPSPTPYASDYIDTDHCQPGLSSASSPISDATFKAIAIIIATFAVVVLLTYSVQCCTRRQQQTRPRLHCRLYTPKEPDPCTAPCFCDSPITKMRAAIVRGGNVLVDGDPSSARTAIYSDRHGASEKFGREMSTDANRRRERGRVIRQSQLPSQPAGGLGIYHLLEDKFEDGGLGRGPWDAAVVVDAPKPVYRAGSF